MNGLFSIFWFSKAFNTSELYIHWIGLKKYFTKEFIKHYQNECRFYLDEYSEQQELRKEWFNKNTLLPIITFTDYRIKDGNNIFVLCEDQWKELKKVDYIKTIDDIVNDFCYFESDQFFNNRWMKRN